VLDRIGVDIPIDARVETLPVAHKQLVAIARALASEARLIIMDEPTTALTEREVRSLLGIIRRLKDEGVAVVFVSHKLAEVLEVSETGRGPAQRAQGDRRPGIRLRRGLAHPPHDRARRARGAALGL
jgi:ABC-type nitrate/sulfonate/bicarbonate transport system ATPase subunit